MSLKDKKRSLIEKMEAKGINAKYDSEDRISFKSGDTFFLIQLYPDENEYYRILLPNFYKVSENELNLILKIINDANSKFRFVKTIYVNEALWISIESYFQNEISFINKLDYFIRLSKIAGSEILKKINEEK